MTYSRSFESTYPSMLAEAVAIEDAPDFDNMNEVLRIVKHRGTGENLEYLVEWKDGSEATWVNHDNCYCPNVIFEYQKSKGYWNDKYEVEIIIDSFQNELGQIEYLIKWKDRFVGTKENPSTWYDAYSWVNENDMTTAQDLIDEFHRKGFQYVNGSGKRWVRKIYTRNGKYPVDCYLVGFEDTPGPEMKFYSIDDIYLMPNGRQALRRFNERLHGMNEE